MHPLDIVTDSNGLQHLEKGVRGSFRSFHDTRPGIGTCPSEEVHSLVGKFVLVGREAGTRSPILQRLSATFSERSFLIGIGLGKSIEPTYICILHVPR